MSKEELFKILKDRFNANMNRHEHVLWEEVVGLLDNQKIESLVWMEETKGEPDVFKMDDGRLCFIDASAESPSERRSLCYDDQALNERKANKPVGSAMGLATQHQIELIDETQYFFLQQFGDFDVKTSSWLKTPQSVRQLKGAIFGDKRFNRVFIYHNGADSYYSARGFRGILWLVKP